MQGQSNIGLILGKMEIQYYGKKNKFKISRLWLPPLLGSLNQNLEILRISPMFLLESAESAVILKILFSTVT
jgi:hypothetical protein